MLTAASSVALLALLLFPIYWMISASVTPESQLFASPPLLPLRPSFEHYRALFDERDFLIPIRNSLVVAAMTTVVALPVAALCAYALARLQFKGRGLLLALILAVSMFPQISIVPPLYLMLRELRLLDT
jgi:ABC-type glycerol-3-phosphate transport system permease component